MPAQATILKNILSFTGLVVGVPASLPHLLNVNGTGVYPDIVLPDIVGGFTITADATTVTVTRLTGSPSAVDVYVERWHTIEYVTPPGELATKIPFVVAGGVGGSGFSPSAFVYDVTGSEPGFGTSLITIPIPARLSTSYIALAQNGGRVDDTLVMYSCPVSGYTLATIQIQATQEPAIGDKILVFITGYV